MSRHTEVRVEETCTCDLCGKSIHSDVSTGCVAGMRQGVQMGDKYVDISFDIKVFVFNQMPAQDLCYDCRKAILRKLADF